MCSSQHDARFRGSHASWRHAKQWSFDSRHVPEVDKADAYGLRPSEKNPLDVEGIGGCIFRRNEKTQMLLTVH
jgi:hypothetical protein